jgi:hypothetical protein
MTFPQNQKLLNCAERIDLYGELSLRLWCISARANLLFVMGLFGRLRNR